MIDNGKCYALTGLTDCVCVQVVNYGACGLHPDWGTVGAPRMLLFGWTDNNASGMCGAYVMCNDYYPPSLSAENKACSILSSFATAEGKTLKGIQTLTTSGDDMYNFRLDLPTGGNTNVWICAGEIDFETWLPDKLGAEFDRGNSTPLYGCYDVCVNCDVCCTCNYDLYCTCNYDVCCTYQCDVYICTPKDGSLYLWREPCETDGVLYFGLPNYAIGSIPIKRIKCTIDNTPSVSYMRNESSRAECWSARDMAFAENSNMYKFCFITFPNNDESLIDNVPKMMSCAIWYYLCSYKCEAGQYVAMCKSSVNVLNRDMCGAKMTYYSFQGYSIGGAYL